MEIYWRYGKDIDVLLYIDRIIFIKIHLHVQALVGSCVVLRQAPLLGEGVAACARGVAPGPRRVAVGSRGA